MKKMFKKALAVLLSVLMAFSFAAFPLGASAAENNKEKNYTEGEVIAVLKNGVNRNYLLAGTSRFGKGIRLAASHSFKSKKSADLNIAVLKSSSLSTNEMLKKLRSNKDVRYAFPNYKKHISDITNDTYSKFQWALENTGQYGGTPNFDVNAEGLWDKAKGADKEQIIAICDTGLDFEHPEFEGLIWTNPYGSKLVGKNGYDFTEINKDGVPRDGNGHGTHCAGIIAAKANNEMGISGINQSKVKIMPVKWLDDDGFGDDASVLAAYDYISRAIDLGTNVTMINNSWGGMGNLDEQEMYDEVFDKLGEKGAISFIAAGNDGADLSDHSSDSFFSDEDLYTVPACSESKYALTVAATNEKDELADFSNYSSEYVDIAAPGVDILSTVSYNCFNPSIYSDEQKAALIKNIQDFEGSFTAGDFGYPTVKKPGDESYHSDNLTFALENSNFGVEAGHCLTFTSHDEIKKGKYKEYAVEIPFTVEDETKPYRISMTLSGLNDSVGGVFDVPADYNLEDIETLNFYALFYGSKTANYWAHRSFIVNDADEDGEPSDSAYIQDKNRKLVFLWDTENENSTFKIDNLAISKQDVNEDDFGKYDYFNGTSMATPYAVGAAALLKSAYPDASVFDIVNMIKNTGRISENLDGKSETKKVLSLDNPEAIPPMVFKAEYNKDGKVEISGSFRNITKVEVNAKEVTPVSKSNSKIVINDDGYNTKKTVIKVTNAQGSDTLTALLSKRPVYPKSTDVMGEPSAVSGGVMLPVNDQAYYINKYGNIGRIFYDSDMALYSYEEPYFVDFNVLFGDDLNIDSCRITSAAYTDSKLFFTALYSVTASNGSVIGIDSVLGYVDLSDSSTKKLCELPDETVIGGTLAAYNGTVYLAGGIQNGEFSNAFYRYNASKKKFEKQSANLPEGRAFTKFIQYENKLIGVYGSVKSGAFPYFITYDGKSWSKSKVALSSDDYKERFFENGKSYKVYDGNLGYGNGGVFCNGAYVYGKGDSFTYQINSDTVTAFKYSAKNTLEDGNYVSTTLPGCFIAFPVTEEEGEITDISVGKKSAKGDAFDEGGEGEDISDFQPESSAVKINMTTSYAKLDTSALKNAKVTNALKGYTYGEKTKLKLAPNYGYIINSISVNAKAVSTKSNYASVQLTAANNKITASTKRVAPVKVKSLKAKVKSGKITLSWKKTDNTSGYQVQQYKKGKWKTVKTIKKAKTVKYTTKKLKKGTYKFRVRAYRKFGGKTYYGPWAAKKVKVK